MPIDVEDLKDFAKKQGAPEANDLNHWDMSFWSERLRESKFDINEVGSLFVSRSIWLYSAIFYKFKIDVIVSQTQLLSCLTSLSTSILLNNLFTGRTTTILLIAKSYGWSF